MDAHDIWTTARSPRGNRLKTIHAETQGTARTLDVRITPVCERRGVNAANYALRQEFSH
jgi:hypothetical protein